MTKCNCKGCKKKLSLVESSILCKCKGVFCSTHRDPKYHNCQYNYKNDDPDKLIKQMECKKRKVMQI